MTSHDESYDTKNVLVSEASVDLESDQEADEPMQDAASGPVPVEESPEVHASP